MGKKHVNDGKTGNRSAGSEAKSEARRPSGGRERNIGHKNDAEHNRVAKGNPGPHKR